MADSIVNNNDIQHDHLQDGEFLDFTIEGRPLIFSVNHYLMKDFKLNQLIHFNGSFQKSAIVRGVAEKRLWFLFQNEAGLSNLGPNIKSADDLIYHGHVISHQAALPNEVSPNRFSAINPPLSLSLPQQQIVINHLESLVKNQCLLIGDAFYVISLMWLKSWREGSAKLCKIDNHWLVESEENDGFCPITTNVINQQDYVCVRPLIWNFLYAWYGGGPILKRTVVQSSPGGSHYVEVRPKKIIFSCQVLNPKTLALETQQKYGYFSAATKVSALKTAACELFGLQNVQDTILYDASRKPLTLNNLDETLEVARIGSFQTLVIEGKPITPAFCSTLVGKSVFEQKTCEFIATTHASNNALFEKQFDEMCKLQKAVDDLQATLIRVHSSHQDTVQSAHAQEENVAALFAESAHQSMNLQIQNEALLEENKMLKGTVEQLTKQVETLTTTLNKIKIDTLELLPLAQAIKNLLE